MGLPIGAEAPLLQGVDFSVRGTALLLMSQGVFRNLTPRAVAVFHLLAEWGEIPGLQVAVISPGLADEQSLSTLQQIASRILTVYDPWNSVRRAYGFLDDRITASAFFFIDRAGRVVYRWLGTPIFGRAWDSMLRVPQYLADYDNVPSDLMMFHHPDTMLNVPLAPFKFPDLNDDLHTLPVVERPSFIYFIRGVPDVEYTAASAVVARLFDGKASFFAVTPGLSAEGLLSNRAMVERGLREDIVAPEAEEMFGPVPALYDAIEKWVTTIWRGSLFPEMKETERALGVPVLRDMDLQALYSWGLGTFGFESYLVLGANGAIISRGRVREEFEPLYVYWLEEVIGGSD